MLSLVNILLPITIILSLYMRVAVIHILSASTPLFITRALCNISASSEYLMSTDTNQSRWLWLTVSVLKLRGYCTVSCLTGTGNKYHLVSFIFISCKTMPLTTTLQMSNNFTEHTISHKKKYVQSQNKYPSYWVLCRNWRGDEH